MRKLVFMAAALMLAGCASAPKPSITHPSPSITQKKAKPAELATANQTVKKRWQWPHPKWFSK